VLNDLAERLGSPLRALFISTEHFYWLYLVLTVLAGFLLCYRRAPIGPGRLGAALRVLFPARVILHPSALLDYRFVIVNHVLYALGLGFLTLSVSAVTDKVAAGLNFLFGPGDAAAQAGPCADVLFSLVTFLVADAALFLQHWLHHRVPFLWEFHKVHHSAEVLTPLTAERLHPVNDLLGSVVVATFVGVNNAIFLHLYPGGFTEVTVAGVNIFYFLAFTFGVHHLQHSHVWLVFPRGLREWLFSPALHLIHHSKNPAHYNTNFAVTFTFWDRLAGTLYIPAEHERETLELGLEEADQQALQTLWQLYMTPFRNIFAWHGGAGSRQAGPTAPAGAGIAQRLLPIGTRR
jgi:sterol desaturase/sphingolipid hydroxylase (fatty acid hydroxylase superfamily)